MIVLLAIVTIAYFKRVHTLRGDVRRRVSWLRQVSFSASILLLVGEPLSPLGVWDELSFTIHMIEHLLIGDLAALLDGARADGAADCSDVEEPGD